MLSINLGLNAIEKDAITNSVCFVVDALSVVLKYCKDKPCCFLVNENGLSDVMKNIGFSKTKHFMSKFFSVMPSKTKYQNK